MTDEIEVKAASLLEHITIRVKGMRTANLRCAIATKIFEFGAFIAGCALEIEADDRRR